MNVGLWSGQYTTHTPFGPIGVLRRHKIISGDDNAHNDPKQTTNGFKQAVNSRRQTFISPIGLNRTMRRSILVLVLISLIVMLPVVSAATVWETTADFDAGTYSTSQGFSETVSNTCDKVMLSNRFALAGTEADEFCVDDADADTWMWDVCLGSGSSGSGNITGGEAVMSIPSHAGEDTLGLRAANNFTGDFTQSISVHLGASNPSTSAVWFTALNAQVCRYSEGSSADGLLYDWFQGVLYVFKIIDGGTNSCGSSTAFTADPGWLQIARTGDDWTASYSSDGVSWTLDETCSIFDISPDAIYPKMVLNDGGDPAAMTADLDSFKFNSDNNLWRDNGTWLSQNVTNTPGVRQVIIDHVNLTADNYIDKVELLQNAIVVETFADNIVTGSQTTILAAGLASGPSVQVRITLAGNGSSTPEVTRVEFTDMIAATMDFTMTLVWVVLWVALVVCGVVVFWGLGLLALFAGVFMVLEINTALQSPVYTVLSMGLVFILFVMTMFGGLKRR